MGSELVRASATDIEAVKAHAKIISASGLVPAHFQKYPTAVYTAIGMARSLGEDPVQLMQACFFVGGKMGLSSSYLLSRLRRSGAIKGTVRYHIEGKGESLSVTASCVDAETGDVIEGPAATMAMAKAENWTKNEKYKSMPEIMLRNRALAFLVRYQYPDVLAGLHTVEELQDVRAAVMTVSDASPVLASLESEIHGDAPADEAQEAGCGQDEEEVA